MVEGYNALEGSQTDINRRILRRLDALEAVQPYDDTALKGRVKAVEDEIGDEETENTILKDIKDLEDEIGDEETAGTILKRIKDLETAAQTSTPEAEPSNP